MKQHINNGVVGSPGRFKRPRICQFEGCEKPAKYKWCEDHARETMLQQKRDRSRKNWKKTQKSQRSVAKRQNDDRLDAIAKEPKAIKAYDLQNAPADKLIRILGKIRKGEQGYVGL